MTILREEEWLEEHGFVETDDYFFSINPDGKVVKLFYDLSPEEVVGQLPADLKHLHIFHQDFVGPDKEVEEVLQHLKEYEGLRAKILEKVNAERF